MTRRDILRNAALAAAAGASTAASGQHVHQAAEAGKKEGPYKPRAFTAAEWTTVRRLCELIIPADELGKGALEGGAPEYIDLLCANNPELAALWTGGLSWVNQQSRTRFNAEFAAARPEEQTQLLDLIAYRGNQSLETGPGIRFFDLARRMTVDAFYTSAAGIRTLGFAGNKGMSEFQVPLEAIEYAVNRSGL